MLWCFCFSFFVNVQWWIFSYFFIFQNAILAPHLIMNIFHCVDVVHLGRRWLLDLEAHCVIHYICIQIHTILQSWLILSQFWTRIWFHMLFFFVWFFIDNWANYNLFWLWFHVRHHVIFIRIILFSVTQTWPWIVSFTKWHFVSYS